jgi:hypothetical protein
VKHDGDVGAPSNGGARALELVVKMMRERVPSAVTKQMTRL